MKIVNYFVFFLLLYCTITSGQTVDEIVERVYKQTIVHEELLDSLKNYTYVQKIHFIKMDGDGEIDEQSKREYLVEVLSRNDRQRELISAFDYEDEKWIDVSENEKTKDPKERESARFSLTEMVSPESRKNYQFDLVGEEVIDSLSTYHLRINPFETDEEKLSGDLWFETDSYNLVKARLIPSENPTGVKSMVMDFSMGTYNKVWLPEKIIFEAEVSFLIIFKGKIYSEIRFEDYRFGEE